jgi:hypothetical protein
MIGHTPHIGPRIGAGGLERRVMTTRMASETSSVFRCCR